MSRVRLICVIGHGSVAHTHRERERERRDRKDDEICSAADHKVKP